MSPQRELELLLRPAGAGIFTVSTGRLAQLELQSSLYGVSRNEDVEAAWRHVLTSLPTARLAILGIPSDCGAGLVRGASFGPQELRRGLLETRPDFRSWALAHGVVDVGDVAVNPHLLHDDMLSEEQKRASRAALYPSVPAEEGAGLPVSPLSMAERALDRIFDLNPRIKILVLGGDHSVAWPLVVVLKRRRAPALGVVQPDAHTDLLPERLGVKICFATWAYHANELIGRNGRLVQVGIRSSRKPREHWEGTLGVRQFWAADIAARGEAAILDEVVEHLRARGVEQLYFSNDIDATDAECAPSTGAPEEGGLQPEFVCSLISRLGQAFDLVGADLVEVAPPIGSAEQSRRTVAVGVRYLLATLEAMLEGKLVTTTRLERELDQGWDLLEAGDVPEASRTAEHLHRTAPEAPEALMLLAACARARNEPEEALRWLEATIRLAPDWAEPELHVAEVLAEGDDVERALLHARRGGDKAEDDLSRCSAIALCASLELDLDRPDDARSTLSRLPDPTTVDPTPEVGLEIADLYLSLEEPAPARLWFERVVDLDSKMADAWHGLGLCAEMVGNEAEKRRAWLETMALDAEQDEDARELLSEKQTAEVAEAALAELPSRVQQLLADVPILITDRPARSDVATGLDPRLLGLFSGTAYSEAAAMGGSLQLTQILLFRRNLERVALDEQELRAEIRTTLLHETGHFFGLSEDDLHELGLG